MLFVRKPLPVVSLFGVSLGCDPEFFFRSGDKIVGAETVLPEKGINIPTFGATNKIIIDGVQAEINPAANTCRAILSSNIKACFVELDKTLKEKKITADFSRAIEISKESLAVLKEESRKFGCAPSNNQYRTSSGFKIETVNPEEYRVRAAGGHIHLGFNKDSYNYKNIGKNKEKLVRMLDIILANTCVLIDRDPANIERRKVYGKAGEYRLPKHGLEYRTLSNFWLTSYQLMSFVFGTARYATYLMNDANADRYYKAFTSKVLVRDLLQAINMNDVDVAWENFEKIKPLLIETTPESGAYTLTASSIPRFEYFAKKVQAHGLEYWFKDEPMKHWLALDGNRIGWYDWTHSDVVNDMIKNKAA